jgi:pimeloyl-ACP methyl ester carboxylesterase
MTARRRGIPAEPADGKPTMSPRRSSGRNAPSIERVVFLPGAGGAAEFWHPVGRTLPSRWDKRYLSWPGLGDQPADPAVEGFDDLVALVHKHLTLPVQLVAQSMGAVVAIRVALQHPELVQRLVLVATSGGLEMAGLDAKDWRQDYRSAYPRAASWVTETHPAHTRDLSAITTPTVLVSGDADPISPPAVGQRLRALMPNATLEVVAGGNHDLALTHAAQLARLIRGAG